MDEAMDAFYRSQRALSSDDTMVPAHALFLRAPPSGLITPPRTPPPCMMDLDPPSSPISHSMSSPTIAADAFPHIVDAIFAYASHDALATLRAVCRAWRDRADARLLSHIVLQDEYVPALPAGGPIRTDWAKYPAQTLDVVDLDLANPRALPPEVGTLRARSIARWNGDISSFPPSQTLVLSGAVSDGAYGPAMRTWAPYLRHTTRLVAHYNPRQPELGAWGAMGAALALPSCTVREVVFVFSGAADEIDISVLGPLLMLSMQLGWHVGKPPTFRMTLVNALPWFSAGVEAGEALSGESEDVHALFLRAAGFGRTPVDDVKAAFGHYFSYTTFDEYAARVGAEQFALEMGVPRRIGPQPLLKPLCPSPMRRIARI
jgi:hypothetical protein